MRYKHDYDKTLTRLRIILQRLNDGEALVVKELAEEFNVSTRTIQRDFNEKLVGSYPIYQENKKWKMQDGFKIEKIRDIEDQIVLDIIEKITDGIGGKFALKSKNLLSKIKNEEQNPIYTKLNIEDISDKLKEIQLLEIAIKDKKIVNCIYYFEDYSHELTIKPLKIVNFEGFWYLVALDSRNDILKKYYFKNISSIKILNEFFTTTSKIDQLLENSISVWFQEDNEPFEVKLFISKEISKYLKRKPLSKNQIIDSVYDDSSMKIVIKITHEMEILPIVKYWLPHIKIIEPQWLRDNLNEDLNKYLKPPL